MSSAQTEERERKTESIKQQKNMLPNTEPARETRGPWQFLSSLPLFVVSWRCSLLNQLWMLMLSLYIFLQTYCVQLLHLPHIHQHTCETSISFCENLEGTNQTMITDNWTKDKGKHKSLHRGSIWKWGCWFYCLFGIFVLWTLISFDLGKVVFLGVWWITL